MFVTEMAQLHFLESESEVAWFFYFFWFKLVPPINEIKMQMIKLFLQPMLHP